MFNSHKNYSKDRVYDDIWLDDSISKLNYIYIYETVGIYCRALDSKDVWILMRTKSTYRYVNVYTKKKYCFWIYGP